MQKCFRIFARDKNVAAATIITILFVGICILYVYTLHTAAADHSVYENKKKIKTRAHTHAHFITARRVYKKRISSANNKNVYIIIVCVCVCVVRVGGQTGVGGRAGISCFFLLFFLILFFMYERVPHSPSRCRGRCSTAAVARSWPGRR